MNAPFFHRPVRVGLIDLADPGERCRVEAFVRAHPQGSPFHLPAWLEAVASGTGNPALGLMIEEGGEIACWLPLTVVHSPVFGRVLASSGFAVGGGILAVPAFDPNLAWAGIEELAARHACPAIELRGGVLPVGRAGWSLRSDAHCTFIAPLLADDEAQLLAIPRKQRAEVRKGLDTELTVETGSAERDRSAHYAVYAESVRNLGTPVFPRSLFDAVLDRLDAEILTVRRQGRPVASVLSLYHRGAVMPYWGGGTPLARHLRANDRMYFELMRHARARGCKRFDFGRSKTGSGPYHFKRNWGFTPEPLTYAVWSSPGAPVRDADPRSAANSRLTALWRRLPAALADRLGPHIARGLG